MFLKMAKPPAPPPKKNISIWHHKLIKRSVKAYFDTNLDKRLK